MTNYLYSRVEYIHGNHLVSVNFFWPTKKNKTQRLFVIPIKSYITSVILHKIFLNVGESFEEGQENIQSNIEDAWLDYHIQLIQDAVINQRALILKFNL